jgi:hypothetical protein
VLIEIDISPGMGGIAMGLLRGRLLDIGDDHWIESGEGERGLQR